MPVFKYFCPECGLVAQSASDVSGQTIKCAGCQTIFVAQPMNRPTATEAKVLQPSENRGLKPKTVVPEPTAAPAPRPSVVRPPDPPPAPAPAYEPPVESPKPRTAVPPPVPPSPKTDVRPKRRTEAPRQDDDEEIIPLRPVRKKSRWPLMVALLGVGLVFLAGGGTALWFLVLKGNSLKFTAEAPDKAWAIKLPDTPQTNEARADNYEYLYTRPGKDAEFGVDVAESQQADPAQMIDVGAGLMFATAAKKYGLDSLAAAPPPADTSKYQGEYTRRLFEADTGSRGKLSVQLIVVNWSASQSTTFIQVAIGKDITDEERQAFLNSVTIKKGIR